MAPTALPRSLRRILITSALAVATTGSALVAAGPAQAAATTWWVASGGNNGGACSQAAPCATVTGALAKAAASGDTINVLPGTYTSIPLTASFENFYGFSVGVQSPLVAGVPEPSTYALIAAGLAVSGFIGRRRTAAKPLV